jgi:hypothetical protein
MRKSLIRWVDFIEPDRIWKGCTLLAYRIFLDYDDQLLLEFKSPTNDYWTYEQYEDHIQEINQWLNEI